MIWHVVLWGVGLLLVAATLPGTIELLWLTGGALLSMWQRRQRR